VDSLGFSSDMYAERIILLYSETITTESMQDHEH